MSLTLASATLLSLSTVDAQATPGVTTATVTSWAAVQRADTFSTSQWYRVTAKVTAPDGASTARLQVRQVDDGHVLYSRTSVRTAARGAWADMAVQMVPVSGAGFLQVRVRGTKAHRVTFDKIAVSTTAVSPAPAPAPAPGASTACTANVRGIPATGSAYVGQTASGSITLPARESYYGRTVPVHRIYGSAWGVDSAVHIAAADVAAKRLPWLSFQVPGTWKQMSAGTYDSWALSVISKLNAIPGPVWLVFAHEPEHSRTTQNVRDWVAMQKRLLAMVRAHSDNVAPSIIVEGYHQVANTDPTLTMSALWPGDGLVDVIGIDSYNFYGTKSPSGKTFTDMTDLGPWFKVFHDFSVAHHTHWGVAETGYTDAAAAKDVAWTTKTFQQLLSYGGVAMAYFDSTLHTGGYTYPLEPAAKRAQWLTTMKMSTRIC